jgi:nickel-type superoxide dismutase maturation protease
MRGAGVLELLRWAVGSLKRARVEGTSMAPTLRAGTTVLYDPGCAAPNFGDIVVCKHPLENRLLVKRVARRDESGLMLLGDNPDQSTDSRTFGRAQTSDLLGRVVCTLP